MICADPRATPTARESDLHLPVRPGTDLPLLNAMLHVIDARRAWPTRRSSRAHTTGWERGARGRGASGRRSGRRRSAASRPADIERPPRRFGAAPRVDGAVVDGRQPVDGRDAQEPRADQPLPGDRQPRPARQPGRSRSPASRTRWAAARPAGWRTCCRATARSTTPRDRAEMAAHWGVAGGGDLRPRRACRPSSSSTRCSTGRVKAVWIVGDEPARVAAATAAARARRSSAPSCVVVQDATTRPRRRRSPTPCCPPPPGRRRRGR